MSLSAQQKKLLRGQAQLVEATILIGEKTALNEIVKMLAINFKKNPLVKIRFHISSRKTIIALVNEIEAASESFCVAQVGHTATFYKVVPADEQ